MTKKFNTADVLTLTTGLLLTEIGNVYKILNFLTGDDLYTHQIPRASNYCIPSLREQVPQLFSEDIQERTAALRADLKGKETREDRKKIVNKWLEDVILAYGESYTLKPVLPPMKRVDPIQELEEMLEKKNK